MAMNKVTHIYVQDNNKIQELNNKRKMLEQNKIEKQWNQYTDQQDRAERMRIDPEKFHKLGSAAADNELYQQDVEKKLPFINGALSKIIPVLPRNLYLIGGITGGGKSTTVANIIIPILSTGRKILVISNEENRNDVYSRVACRILGYSFMLLKLGELHISIREKINEEVNRLETIMTVIGTDFQDNPDLVCTPEGVKSVFEYFSKDHDAILLDYYQNISSSTLDDRPEPHVHQEKFAYFINVFKNSFGGPIFVMSQLLKAKEKSITEADFKGRVEGRKIIANFAQYHIELIPDFDNYTTKFKFHKERMGMYQGKNVTMGFDIKSQTFVPHDDAFKMKSAQWIADKISIEQDAEKTRDPDVVYAEKPITESDIKEFTSEEITQISAMDDNDELNLDYDD